MVRVRGLPFEAGIEELRIFFEGRPFYERMHWFGFWNFKLWPPNKSKNLTLANNFEVIVLLKC